MGRDLPPRVTLGLGYVIGLLSALAVWLKLA